MCGGKDFSPDVDIQDLTGKVILVTGNTGLGKETVLQLAKHKPAKISLAARTASKAEAAITDIKATVPGAHITFLSLDLTSFASMNIMAVPAGTTEEGYEIQFGTNHIGHALLTKMIMPTLLRTAERPTTDVRILTLTSEGHKLAPIGGILFDKTRLDAQGIWTRYGQSKLANILFTRSLAKKYPSIKSVFLNPGVVRTDLMGPYRKSNALVRYTTAIAGPMFWKSIPQGAKNKLWAATTKADELENGAYYTPVGCKSVGSAYSQDPDVAERLYEWTEKELAAKGY